ncbi:hypothetical protein [Flavobacterium ajazii]|uniref:hypothetical protein n=1 Tax=Flavobacterium ajazii TaxID=2692318 RepID=UPI0013D16383|nr:hypothetical protein [Flavobacterium ajazii]
MPLIRCSEQKRQFLEEFYSEWVSESNEISASIGKSMLKIVDLINKTFTETKIYGLTSHAHLLLLSEDDSMSDWYVAINVSVLEEYHIEYQITKDSQPWENATIKGATKSMDEFKKIIIIAMSESQGWSKSAELNKLFAQIKSGARL